MPSLTYQHIYFIGIGGIGMSALARYFKLSGAEVYGYDKVESALSKQLVAEGMHIHYQEDIHQIPATVDLVVYTPAIPASHSELLYFKANDFVIMKRAEVLGWISRDKKAIGIAGTHGKTTTSAILTHLLKTAGIDCTAFLGGIAANFDSNYVHGNSEWVVMEADEFDRSFLHLYPHVAVITSMDADHLDIYGDVAAMHDSFYDYAHQVREVLVHHQALPFSISKSNSTQYISYGVDQGRAAAYRVQPQAPNVVFDWKQGEDIIENIKFTLPGKHNVLNATAAITVARLLGATAQQIKEALSSFKGIKRRFEYIVQQNRLVYIDDYAHHPEELKMTITAARQLYPNRRITAVFQPHLYSRTLDFADEFAQALDLLDEVVLLDIYPARELPIEGVSTDLIFDKMQLKEKYKSTKADLIECLEGRSIDVLMTLGAGDIGTLVPAVKAYLLTTTNKATNEKI